MRRTLKPVNRNNNRINHFHRQPKAASTGSPSVRKSFWLNDDNALLEDIETISLHNSSSSEEGPRRTTSQPWSDTFQRDYRATNKRWHNNDLVKRFQSKNPLPNNDHGDDNITDHIYTGYYGGQSNNIDDLSGVNREMTCFTIIDRHDAMNSDSSTDKEHYECGYLNEYKNIINNKNENFNEADNNNKSYEEITTNVEQNNDEETRTIWIYSFKNRQDLFNEEHELVNMASRSSSSSFLQDIPEEPFNSSNLRKPETTRVATPIPSSLAPRLDQHLPTLPTVTEISETQSLYEDRNQKTTQKETKKLKQLENSWVSNEEFSKTNDNSISRAARNYELLEFSVEESIENLSNKLTQTKRSTSSQTEFALIVPLLQAEIQRSEDTALNNIKTIQHKLLKSIFSTNDIEYLDRGDDQNTAPNVSSTPKHETETVNNNTWIEEVKSEDKHATYTKEYEEYSNSAGHRLMVKNMALLKPGRWADFYPADSVLSLQLSLGETDFGDGDLPWWQKALKCILCAKFR